MKIIFVQNLLSPHFGIMHISAVLKENGHLTDVFIEGLHKDIVKDICDAKPDLIGFTCITGDHKWVVQRAAEIKKYLNVPVIVGGPHPTFFPEMIKSENIDMIYRGEGEYSILELANRIRKKKNYRDILGLWVKEDDNIYKNEIAPLTSDLDSLPYADREIYDKYDFFRKQTELLISTSRGCPFSCTFCYNQAKKELYGGKNIVRLRTPENILNEIKSLLKKHPNVKSITFNDDNICLNSKWFDDFFEGYAKEIGLPFIASIRADSITEERIKKLKKANCFCLTMGVETGNEDIRRRILKKQISNSDFLKAAKLVKKYQMRLRTSSMCFLPGETIELAFETLLLNKKMKVDYPWAYPLQPYPRTEIYNYAIEAGFLNKSFSFDDIDVLGLLEGPIMPKLKDGNKIKVLQRLFYYGVKVPGFVHLLKFFVYIPNNFIFDFLHRFAILITYAQFHQVNIFRALSIATQAIFREKQMKRLNRKV